MLRSDVPPDPGVSRETRLRLDAFARTFHAWNAAISLVSRRDAADLWPRHIQDSTQLFTLRRPSDRRWVDIGTGGGFPGLIIAILAADVAPDLAVTLVESDRRKAAFLRAAAQASGVQPRILTERAEALPSLEADVLSARAVAPLPTLLSFADRHLRRDGCALFPKGARVDDEVTSALATWRFTVHKIPSRTDPQGVILAIEGVRRA